MVDESSIKKILEAKFPNFKIINKKEYLEIFIKKDEIFDTIKKIIEDSKLCYDQLTDLTAVDYPSREKRFELIYLFLSMTLNSRIIIKSSIKIEDKIESISSLYKSANWFERECYDLFGFYFINHPDLRRIMTDYNFEGHPLRKDFPLTGHTEVRYDDLEKKVVYEPVQLNQEFRNFDYMSPWEGFENELIGDEKSKDKDN